MRTFGCNMPAAQDTRGGGHVVVAAVGAGAEIHHVDVDAPHVAQIDNIVHGAGSCDLRLEQIKIDRQRPAVTRVGLDPQPGRCITIGCRRAGGWNDAGLGADFDRHRGERGAIGDAPSIEPVVFDRLIGRAVCA